LTGISVVNADVVSGVNFETGLALTNVDLDITPATVVDSVTQTKNDPVNLDLGFFGTIQIIPADIVVTDVQSTTTDVVGNVEVVETSDPFVNDITPAFTEVVESVTGDNSGASATGTNSFACGQNATASGDDATALGPDATASGAGSTATGQNAAAGADGATATGQNANAAGERSTAIGIDSNAEGDLAVAVGDRANATGGRSTALGTEASAEGGRATAVGSDATALGGRSTAVGTEANAEGELSTAVGERSLAVTDRSTAIGAGAIADPTVNGDPNLDLFRATAVGSQAEALNHRATAVGSQAIASGRRSTSLGTDAIARGGGTVAVGDNAQTGTPGVGASNAVAIGRNTNAQAAGSVAIGTDSTEGTDNGAVATLENEFVLGTANHTYTARGITSNESRARQSGPLELVTTDENGHLASDNGQIFNQLGEHGSGIAIAMAVENPDLVGNETFGLSANVGFFEGNTALGIAAMGVLGHDFMGGGERWALAGGVGFSLNEQDYGGHSTDRTVGGRAGVQVSW
jgi:hypothetical protein